MRIHAPSLFAGIVAALCLAAFLAADRPTNYERKYQLEATNHHIFVLDRETGRVWQKYVTDNSGHTDQDFAMPKNR